MADTTDLARKLAALGCWRWMRGMTWHAIDGVSGSAWEGVIEHPSPHADPQQGASIWRDVRPDLHDPATVGCLHALAEEVVGGPVEVTWARVAFSATPQTYGIVESGRRAKPRPVGDGPTRGEALAALIVQWEAAHARD